ncbi:serine hydrolase domain-containing protein [Aspergillus candidus]|uniref:Beta-lactamase/transpeptidase-like protein n=1 Tax=Aspergillus candidus TaxID=41067 RepID=A0A2I2F2Q4_ASPCN|nr:beta-lactamase/transpeptidase-like protein [Aspergillus candidus]PLB34925.1 beta-lactamase/transpeptidase-like protein [Aspergillus candidus]
MLEPAIASRLEKAVGDIEEVMQICQAPSISFGVVHKGEVVLRKSLGLRDVEDRLEANPDSIYMLGSCSKMFTAAAVGHLVAQGKMDWLDPVQKHLPEFNPIGDLDIGRQADIIDTMRHSTGLSDPIGLYLGPGNTVLDDDERFIELLNQMPTSNDEGQRFNSYWMYNNGAYGLVSKVVERVARTRFSAYVKENVFKPLGMTRSVVTRSDLDGNIAYPYVQLDDQTFTKLPYQFLGCEENNPMLAVMGMGASLNDMLTWVTAILSAERHEQQATEDEASSDEEGSPASVSNGSSYSSPGRTTSSPLKHVSKIRKAYYTRPTKDQFQNEAAYCMGWLRLTMPSSLLGELSFNTMTKPDSEPHMLGQESPQRLAIGHNGGVMGSLSAIWTFPETDSAVVALANGRSIGDAADFTAQILIQALFDLQPKVDIVLWARKERDLTQKWFEEKYLQPWRSKPLSNHDITRRDSTAYVGRYQGFNGTYTFNIVSQSPKTQSETGSQLAMAFKHSDPDTMRPLYFAGTDEYTFFPGSWNRWLVDSTPSLAYESSVLRFKWDEARSRIEGLWWICVDEKPSWFSRVEEK